MVLCQCPERVSEDPFNFINIRNNNYHYCALLFNFVINFAIYCAKDYLPCGTRRTEIHGEHVSTGWGLNSCYQYVYSYVSKYSGGNFYILRVYGKSEKLSTRSTKYKWQ